MKKFLILIGLMPLAGMAQNQLSLRDCFDQLVKNNLQYRAGTLQTELAETNIGQAKSRALPSLSVNSYQSFNSGRSIDTYTNAFVDQLYNSNSISAGMGLVLFQGFQIQNQIAASKLSRDASLQNQTAVLNNQTLLLVQAYLRGLAQQALWQALKLQVEASSEQVDKATKQVEAGTVGSNVLFEMKAQLSNDKFEEITAQNNYKTALLEIAQLLNLNRVVDFELKPISAELPLAPDLTAEKMYDSAAPLFPEIKAAELTKESSLWLVKVQKGANSPSLSLSGNFGAFYASTNTELAYMQQLNATRNGSLTFGLTIPILSHWTNRPRVQSARVAVKQAQNDVDVAKLKLRQSIESSYQLYTSAVEKLEAAKAQEASQKAGFTLTESRFNAGTASIFEYSLSKSNLNRAIANAIQAQFETLMYRKVLDFYRNGSWEGIL